MSFRHKVSTLLGRGQLVKLSERAVTLITPDIRKRLLANGKSGGENVDHMPVAKFYYPASAANWLITEMIPQRQDILFGLCDLGFGFPELGYLSLGQLERIEGALDLRVERDLSFEAKHPLSVYAEAATIQGAITEEEEALEKAAAILAKKRRGR
jgi:Protein of unknown function (DUF2958)